MSRLVLVVEDDDDILEALSEVLSQAGYEVVGAEDGHKAFARLKEGLRPNLILLDLMMPGMNGWEFRSRQREDPSLAGIPVVLVSADNNAASTAAELGAAGCLRKPMSLEELLSVVERCAT